MSQSSPVLQVTSWNKVSEAFSDEVKNSEVFRALNTTYKIAGKDKDYVYLADLEYGQQLIKNAKLILKFDYSDNNVNVVNDLTYSNDPLGIVLDGFLEVIVSNTSNIGIGKDIKTNKYPILLNRIMPLDFFGVFGTLDHITHMPSTRNSEQWNVFSGPVCYNIDYPYGRASYKLIINHFNERNSSISSIETFDNVYGNKENCGSINRKRIYENVYEYNKLELPKSKIALFPKHIIELADKTTLLTELLKVGWKQSAYIRNNELESQGITNQIQSIITKINSDSSKIKIKHDLNFLSHLCRYIIDCAKGNEYILKPVKGDPFYTAFKNALCNANPRLVNNNKYHLFFYDYRFLTVDSEDDYGIIPLNSLPILTNYSIQDQDSLAYEIKKIFTTIDPTINLEFYGNPRNKETKFGDKVRVTGENFVVSRDRLKEEYLLTSWDIKNTSENKKLMHLYNDEFSQLLLIKRRNN